MTACQRFSSMFLLSCRVWFALSLLWVMWLRQQSFFSFLSFFHSVHCDFIQLMTLISVFSLPQLVILNLLSPACSVRLLMLCRKASLSIPNLTLDYYYCYCCLLIFKSLTFILKLMNYRSVGALLMTCVFDFIRLFNKFSSLLFSSFFT